jgi:hypothetical protein
MESMSNAEAFLTLARQMTVVVFPFPDLVRFAIELARCIDRMNKPAG